MRHLLILIIFHFVSYSAGGLVTAVAPVVIDCKGQWIGWTGLDDFNEVVDTIPESDPEDKAPTAGLLSKQVFCNIVHFIIRCFSIVLYRITYNTKTIYNSYFVSGSSSGNRPKVI